MVSDLSLLAENFWLCGCWNELSGRPLPFRSLNACCTNILPTEYKSREFVQAVLTFAIVKIHQGALFRWSHEAVFRHSSASTRRATGLPPTMCESMISSTSFSVTCPYQTASG